MKTETLNLKTSRGATTAVVARPDGDASAVVILIHEWWGINDHIRDLAGRYAKEGYLCVAPDLFRGIVAKDSEEASRLMHSLDTVDGLETINEAIVKTRGDLGAQRVGITGYCMGSTYALRAACEMSELAAAAPFYGDIPEEKVLAKLKVPTIFFAGTRDNWINPEKIEVLKKATREYNLPIEVVSYDAEHAFFNDTRPEVYDANAARDAWERVMVHFGKFLFEAPQTKD